MSLSEGEIIVSINILSVSDFLPKEMQTLDAVAEGKKKLFKSKQARRGFFGESLPSAGPALLPWQVRELSLDFPISCQPELPKKWLGILCRHLIRVLLKLLGFLINPFLDTTS